MKTTFTKLMAALALLVFMMPSLAGWGQTTTLLNETFSECTSTGGNDNYFATAGSTKIDSNPDNYTDVAGWTASNVYVANKCVKLGGGSAQGSIQTPTIQFASGSNATLSFRAAAWNNSSENTTVDLSITNGTLAQSSVTLTIGAWQTYSIQITGLTGSGKITIAAHQTSKNRFFLDDVVVTQETGGSQTTYTVTLADDNTTLTQASPGASVTLPTRDAIGSYTFAGWSSTNVPDETTTAPTVIPAGAYTPTGDITLYPVYTRTEGGGVSPSAFSVGDTGDFAIVSEMQNGKYYALPTNPTLNSGKITAQEITVSELNGVKYVTTTDADGFTWTIASATNGYSLSDGSKYIYHSNGGSSGTNLAYGTSTSYTWAFTIDGNFVKMAGMNGSTTNSRGLLFSGTTIGGYSLSNWENSGYYKSMILPVCASGITYYLSWPSTGPIITANAPATLAYDATGGEFGYSILNPVSGVTLNAASNSDWITNVAVNSTNSTVTFNTSTNTTYTQRTGTITLSYTGATDKVVTITQEAAPAPTITADDVEIAFDASSGSIAYSITNGPTPAGIMTAAVVSGGTIANLAIGAIENNAVAFTCAANNTSSVRMATVTLTYTYGNNQTVTKNVTITQAASEFEYAILPFAFDGGRAAVATTVGLTQSGLGTDYTPSAANDYSPRLRFDTTDDWLLLKFNERPGELSYDIMGNSFNNSTFKVQTSVDGVTYTDFAIYTSLVSTKQHITHNNLAEDVRYIKWVYTEKVNGNVALGNIELDVYQAPQEYDLTIGTPPNITIIARYGNNQSVVNGNTAAVLSSTVVTLLLTPSSGYVLDLVTAYDAQDNPISLTEVSDNVYSFVMPSIDVTVSADVIAAHQEYYYTRSTSLEPGRRYIIVAERNGKYLAMGAQKNNNRNAKPISVEGTIATVIRSDVHEFTISSIDADPGHYSILDVDAEAPGYLYAGSSTSNYLLTDAELNANGHWSITVDAETGEGTIIAQGSNSRNVMRFNQDNGLFSCYAADNNQYPVYLYMKDDGFDLTINGYTDVTEGTNNKGYYLIASPVEVAPADVPGLTEGTFDLYYYDDSQTLEWINYETSSGINPDFGNLVPGKGYLYAKKATTPGETYTFTLSGEVYSGDGEIPLVDGWNLIGNLYNSQVSPITDYYEMNVEGSEIIAGESWIIEPMQGIFINNEYGETSTSFSILSKGAKKAGLVLNLSRTASKGSTAAVIDRAVVRFGEGRQLPKFQLFENSTKIYIPQGDKDYAVVRSASEGEMPVNFKAETNGTYTLSMNVEEVSLGYLHLIDNMTGTDVDLLATPSYTFDARTTDYESRFKLVFSSICEDADGDNETFAFFNGSGWTVSNVGEATLQVVDVMGRIVNTQNINGNATIHLNETPGIYMLRLVNGNNVKVQKVVVR